MPSADNSALVQKFAPLVYIDSGEAIFPADVTWLLQSAQLQGPSGNTLLQASQVTPTTLIGQTDTQNGSQVRSGYVYDESDPTPKTTGFSLYYADQNAISANVYLPPTGSVLRGQPPVPDPKHPGKTICQAPCYAHVRPIQGGVTIGYAITYCFFYPYNGATGGSGWLPSIGVHVGDWEHVTVLVSPDQGSVVAVYFPTHSTGGWLPPKSLTFATDDTGNATHVVVYSARYSHASYPAPGSHPNPKWGSKALDYTDDQGPSWPTWTSVVDVGDIFGGATPTPGYEWLSYSGRWGNTTGMRITEKGPETPSFQWWWPEEPNEQAFFQAYQNELMRTSTMISAAASADYAAWFVADYNGDGYQDLFGVKVRNTTSQYVEVDVLDGASDYKQSLLHADTPIAATDAANYRWGLGVYGGGQKPNLFAIKVATTGTTDVEVHELSGASNYGLPWAYQHGTAISESIADDFWAWTVSPPTADHFDLFAIKCSDTQNTSSDVEVHVLDGGQQYSAFKFENALPIATADAESYGAWLVADYNKDGYLDLFAICSGPNASGRVQVQVLDGNQKFEKFLFQAQTPIPVEVEVVGQIRAWALADYDGDAVPDLFQINLLATNSGNVEIRVWGGAPLQT